MAPGQVTLQARQQLHAQIHEACPREPKSADEPILLFLCALLRCQCLLIAATMSLLLTAFSAPFHTHFYIHSLLCPLLIGHLFIATMLPGIALRVVKNTKALQMCVHQPGNRHGGPHVSLLINLNVSVGKVHLHPLHMRLL